jgi:hypothetical protein
MGGKRKKGSGISIRQKQAIVALVLVLTFLLVYSPHLGYRFPLHGDEWVLMSDAKNFAGTGKTRYEHEIGYVAFLSAMHKITNLAESLRFLPAVFACISSLVLFFLVSRKANFETGVFAMVFFASLPSNVNILGLWFFVPMTFAIPFLLLFALFFTEGFSESNAKKIMAAVVAAGFLALAHAPTAMLAFAVSGIYMAANFGHSKKLGEKVFKRYPWVAAVPAAVIAWAAYFLWSGSITATISSALSKITFSPAHTAFHVNYFFPELFGWAATIFAAIGIGISLRKGKNSFFIVWISTAIALLLFFLVFKFSVLASYQRALYFAMIGSVPFAAIGLHYFFGGLKPKKAVAGIFLLVVLIAVFYDYYSLPVELMPFAAIDEEDYSAMQFLSQFNSSKVMTHVEASLALPYVSGHKSIQCRRYYDCMESKRIVDAVNFYNNDNCTLRSEILERRNVKYVISREKIECESLVRIFHDGDYVYEFAG